MNNYGHQAMAYWERVAPGQFQALEDPQGYFTEVGELLAQVLKLDSKRNVPNLSNALRNTVCVISSAFSRLPPKLYATLYTSRS